MDRQITYSDFSGKDLDLLISENRNNLIILLFTADWLGSARILEEFLSEIIAGRPSIKVYHVDIEKNRSLCTRMNVGKLPAAVFLKDRKISDSFTGLIPKRKIETKIENLLFTHT